MSDQLPLTFENGVTVLSVVSPTYVDDSQEIINLTVGFSHLPDVVIFSASSQDSELHSRALYELAKTGEFGDVAQPEAESQSVIVARAKVELEALLLQANNTIAWLEDAEELDMATESEKAKLTAWKTYRVLLNRVDLTTAPDIDWPTLPDL